LGRERIKKISREKGRKKVIGVSYTVEKAKGKKRTASKEDMLSPLASKQRPALPSKKQHKGRAFCLSRRTKKEEMALSAGFLPRDRKRGSIKRGKETSKSLTRKNFVKGRSPQTRICPAKTRIHS